MAGRSSSSSAWIKQVLAVLLLLSGCTGLAAQADAVCQPATAWFAPVVGTSTLVSSQQSPVVLSGSSVSITVRFDDGNFVPQPTTNMSFQLTMDDTPLSGTLTDPSNLTYSWDISALNGRHVLSVTVLSAPPGVCYWGREYYMMVNVTPASPMPNQLVPTVGEHYIDRRHTPAFSDRLNWPGGISRPRNVAHPYPLRAPVLSVGDPGAGLGWYTEPLLNLANVYGETHPTWYRTRQDAVFMWDFSPESPSLIVDAAPGQVASDYYDGQRDDNAVSPYADFVPNPDSVGFYGASIEGRLFSVGLDGTVLTLAGFVTRRDIVPYDPLDSLADHTSPAIKTTIGDFTCGGTEPLRTFSITNDVAVDPRFTLGGKHNVFYVADVGNSRIARVTITTWPTLTTQAVSTICTYAGQFGVAGYRDSAQGPPLFDAPVSIIVKADGTMYVSDQNNNALRRISPAGVVTTVIRNGDQPTKAQVVAASAAACPNSTYVPLGPTPFSSAYFNYPFGIRFDSLGNIVVAESVSGTVRYVDMAAGTISTMACGMGGSDASWTWIDVDRKQNVSAQRDDVLILPVPSQGLFANVNIYRIPITARGIAAGSIPLINWGTCPGASATLTWGFSACIAEPATHYVWGIAISDQEARMLVSGFGTLGLASLRPVLASDAWNFNYTSFTGGGDTWYFGTNNPASFLRPSFADLHGSRGYARLGTKTVDDMALMPLDPTLCSPGSLQAYLRNGAEGNVPRPELACGSQNLADLVYFIRRSALGGDGVTP